MYLYVRMSDHVQATRQVAAMYSTAVDVEKRGPRPFNAFVRSQKWDFMKDGEDPSPTAAGHIYRMAEEALHRLQVQGPTEVGSQQPTLAADRQSRPALCARNCAGQQESVTARIRPADTNQGLH